MRQQYAGRIDEGDYVRATRAYPGGRPGFLYGPGYLYAAGTRLIAVLAIPGIHG